MEKVISEVTADCVCFNIEITLPNKQRFQSYLRVSLPEKTLRWFLSDAHDVAVLEKLFPDSFDLSYFIESMQNLFNSGGSWKWILVNNPKNRYKKLWGGTLPTSGKNYGELDRKMLQPTDEDALKLLNNHTS